MTNCAHIDRGIIIWVTCAPYTYHHVCGNEVALPKFEWIDGRGEATIDCKCGKILDFFVTNGREIRVLERVMSRAQYNSLL